MATFFIKTFGCAYNQADSETMAAVLAEAGHSRAEIRTADVVIANTCSVKTPTQDKILNFLQTVNKPLVVAGCLVQAMPGAVEEAVPGASLVGTFAHSKIAEAVEAAAKGEKAVFLGRETRPALSALPVGKIAIVKIAEGCASSCSFCQTKLARGALRSNQPKEIVRATEEAIAAGAKEIRLTAQDTGCYGKDIGSSLSGLMESVCSIDGDFMVRIGMMNPQHFAGDAAGLLRTFSNPKVYKLLHLPVQNGSDRVLAEMNRGHTAMDFESLAAAFRKKFPQASIETDVIVGYPSETEEDFAKTIALVGRVRPDMTNVSKFYARPGTRAALLRPLPTAVVKQRSAECSAAGKHAALAKHKEFIGRTLRVLVTQKAGRFLAGRTKEYRKVLVKTRKARLGEWADARITAAAVCHLVGETA